MTEEQDAEDQEVDPGLHIFGPYRRGMTWGRRSLGEQWAGQHARCLATPESLAQRDEMKNPDSSGR
jgi:hypothetical protein